MRQTLIEILSGFAVIFVIYNIFVFSLHTSPTSAATGMKSTSIFSGFADSSAITDMMFNCSVPNLPGYIPIVPSINLSGGSQFSYSLWVFVGDPNAALNRTIFLKGDPTQYKYDIRDNITNSVVHVNGRVAFCPQLSFGSQRMSFELSFNTFDNVRETLKIDNVRSSDSVLRHNLASMYTSRWLLLTMTFEDSKKISVGDHEHEDGLLVKFYLNDVLYVTRQYDTTIKQNLGNLYVFPDGNAVPKCKIADLSYHNYAITDKKIGEILSAGPSTQIASFGANLVGSAPLSTVSNADFSKVPMVIGDYNRTDMYNA